MASKELERMGGRGELQDILGPAKEDIVIDRRGNGKGKTKGRLVFSWVAVGIMAPRHRAREDEQFC